MKKKGIAFRKICLLVGACLLLGAIAALALWQWNIRSAETQAKTYVETLQALIPKPQNAALEERRDNTMAVLSVDGKDFVGILELPQYAAALPVCDRWEDPSGYPCRFYGSIYNGSLQLGATTQTGQFDFYRQLSVGDRVVYTDVEGNRYTFAITSLHRAAHVDQAALQQEEAPLTLFIKNIYSFEYLIVFCNMAGTGQMPDSLQGTRCELQEGRS